MIANHYTVFFADCKKYFVKLHILKLFLLYKITINLAIKGKTAKMHNAFPYFRYHTRSPARNIRVKIAPGIHSVPCLFFFEGAGSVTG